MPRAQCPVYSGPPSGLLRQLGWADEECLALADRAHPLLEVREGGDARRLVVNLLTAAVRRACTTAELRTWVKSSLNFADKLSASLPASALPAPRAPDPEQPGPERRPGRGSFLAFHRHVAPGLEIRRVTELMIAKFEEAVERYRRGETVRIVLVVPPRCGKTTTFGQVGPAWVVGELPDRAILAFSLSQDKAADTGDEVLDIVESDAFREAYPEVQVSKTARGKRAFKHSADPNEPAAQASYGSRREGARRAQGRVRKGKYVCYGVDGRFTGRDADVMICDDLLDEKDADKEVYRRRVHRRIRAMRQRFNPSGNSLWIMIGSRTHVDDGTGYALREYAREGWEVVEVPITEDADRDIEIPATASGLGGMWRRPAGEVLAPYSRAEHDARRADLMSKAPHEWAAQYMCRPVPVAGNMVSAAWVPDRVLPEHLRGPGGVARERMARVALSVDTSEGRSASGARTAVGAYAEPHQAWGHCGTCLGAPHAVGGCSDCGGAGRGPRAWLLEVLAWPWQVPDQAEVLVAACERWRPNWVLIEAKSSGCPLAQYLQRDPRWRWPILLVETGSTGKVARMSSATGWLKGRNLAFAVDERGRVLEPSWRGVGHDPREHESSAASLRDELQAFPSSTYKDRSDQLSQWVNWQVLTPLPPEHVQPRVPSAAPAQGRPAAPSAAELSRRLSTAIKPRGFAAR